MMNITDKMKIGFVKKNILHGFMGVSLAGLTFLLSHLRIMKNAVGIDKGL